MKNKDGENLSQVLSSDSERTCTRIAFEPKAKQKF